MMWTLSESILLFGAFALAVTLWFEYSKFKLRPEAYLKALVEIQRMKMKVKGR